MKLKEIMSQSFKYPLTNVKRLLILGILIAFSILIIPGILALGYFIRVIDSNFKGSNELPPFNEWKRMFIDGLKYIVVILVYIGVPFFVASLLGAFVSILLPATLAFNTFMLIWIVIMILVMIVPYFLSFMGVARMVKEDKIGAAFDFRELLSIIKTIGIGRYAIIILIMTLLTFLCTEILDIAPIYNLNVGSIYIVISLVYIILGSYLIIFEGKLTFILYQEGLKE